MNRYFYDLHVHSCLSPCADNDMTPGNIAGMANLKGLQLVALTDHNTTGNCRAFFAAARRMGIVPVAGMEMTTAEDVHMICLFPSLEAAEAFDASYRCFRVLYPNRPEIFGDQLLVNEEDEVVGREENLLLNASTLSIAEAAALVRSHDGVFYPAHIDREENGIIASLGALPEDVPFGCVEFRDAANIEAYKTRYGLQKKHILTNSDAHYLWDINEAQNALFLEDEPYSSARVREALLHRIGGEPG